MKKGQGAAKKKSKSKAPTKRNILVSKTDIASIFEDMANLLEITGANPFKIRAFVNAARELESLPGDLVSLVNTGELLETPGIGKGIFAHIQEILETGTFAEFDTLRGKIPPGLLTMLRIPGVGPKKVKILYEELDVKSVEELELAANTDRIADLPGFGDKSQEKILSGISRMRRFRKRHLLSEAAVAAESIYNKIAAHPDVKHALLGGSLRRARETVKDIDILVSATRSESITELLTTLPEVESVTAKGATKTSVALKNGINVDLRIVESDEFPFAAMYFTGSKEHNTDMRGRAKKMGFKLNEYGLFRDDEATPCKDEADVFAKLGLDFIEPELRESMGEIEAAQGHTLPELITEDDLKGLIHVHIDFSGDAGSIAALAAEAKSLGMSYLGIVDRSDDTSPLTASQAKDQAKIVGEINKTLDGMTVLHGIECEILADGSLAATDDVLDTFDFVIGAVHAPAGQSEEQMTERLITAIKNPNLTILAHPSGRTLPERTGYDVDLNAVITACATEGALIEINARPSRLDLDWRYVRSARDRGVKLLIGSGTDSVEELSYFRYGVGCARKGWLTADDVANTLTVDAFRNLMRQRRR